MVNKPSIPKGTRDFSSKLISKRNYVLRTIEKYFKNFGFSPIETPAMENLSTLMGKYGEEGDRLIFKILNSGDFLSKNVITKKTSYKELTSQISDKALRYDLTVPFARYVSQNINRIVFPFKRYQMQTVWRADRPQRGRFREFYQCDADVVGSDSLLCEVELVKLYDDIFTALGLKDFSICINNRKILSGIAEIIGEKERVVDITIALDKIGKIGIDKVREEMLSKGVSELAIFKMQPLFNLTGSNEDQLDQMKQFLSTSEVGLKGVEELSSVLATIAETGLQKAKLELDITLARGLNYYTGAILEVKANEVEIGSIGGGGRYDNLTGIFGISDISGVGISFGLDRICLVLEELNLYPELIGFNTQVMFVNFGNSEAVYCMSLLKKLRSEGISSEIYPDSIKMKKQMNYANKKSINYVVLVGENEIKSGQLTVRDMVRGTQKSLTINELISLFK